MNRIERHRLLADQTGWYSRFANPRHTRALITGWAASVAATILGVALTYLGGDTWLIPGGLGALGVMVFWTLLRGSIRMRDSAPRELLDDYEAEVLDRWIRRGYRALAAVIYAVGMALILSATLLDTVSWEALVALGMLLIITMLTVTSLPAIGYALTFNADPER